MDKINYTLTELILAWLEENPGWWTRREIAAGVGRSKTSQMIRCLETLVVKEFVSKSSMTEYNHIVMLYSLCVNPSDYELPF